MNITNWIWQIPPVSSQDYRRRVKRTVRDTVIGMSAVVLIVVLFVYLPAKLKYKPLTQPGEAYSRISVSAAADGFHRTASVEWDDASRLLMYLGLEENAQRRRGNDSLQFEPYFTITVEYKDGKSDVINCMPENTKLSANTKWYLWRDDNKYFAADKYATVLNELEAYLT